MKKVLPIFIIFWVVYMFFCLISFPYLVRFGGERSLFEKIILFISQTPFSMSNPNFDALLVLVTNGFIWSLTIILLYLLFKKK